jgi:hypothetical protein
MDICSWFHESIDEIEAFGRLEAVGCPVRQLIV